MQDLADSKTFAAAKAVVSCLPTAHEKTGAEMSRQPNCHGLFKWPGRQTARVMKLTLLLLTVGLLQARANGYSQQVTLDVKDASLVRVFAIIKQQTGYVYFGATDLLAKARPVTIKVTNAPLETVLQQCFKDQPLDYMIDGKTISVFEKKKGAGTSISLGAPAPMLIDIRGRVTNEENDAVAGVSVLVKGTKTGTYTDGDGEFSLSKVNHDAVLVLTAVNIQSIEAPVGGQRNLDLKVKGKTGKLDEVQVIAYGKTSQRYNTGNTATVKAEDIEKQPVNNPLLALQGRVPGLEITPANGNPGTGVRIRIQGRNNLMTGVFSDPLIVIDGVPYPAQQLKTFQPGAGGSAGPVLGGSTQGDISPGSPLAFLNPADIESIDILKDADATAIYGSRAANGAILITTQKGKAGETKVDLNLQHGIGQVPVKLDLLNTAQYLEMRREAKRNNHANILATDYDLNGIWDTTRYTDWQQEMIGGTAQFTRLSAAVSGGTQWVNYRLGGTYGRETSVFPGNFANNKGSLQFNLNGADRSQRFQLSLTASFMADDNRLPGKDFTDFIFLAPNAPALYNPDGTLNWAPNASGVSSWTNPLSYNENIFDITSNNLVSNLTLSYKILPNLSLRANLGFNQLQSNQFLGALDGSVAPESRAAMLRSSTTSRNTIRSWISEPQLNYSLQHFLGGRLEALLGAAFQNQYSEGMSVTALGQSSDQLLRNLAAATSFNYSSDNSIYRYTGFFGRIHYVGNDRYLLNLSARRDGSSRFGRNNLFANFWAVGAGWIFSEAGFVKNSLSWLSFGKLRGSYGLMGNDQIGNYQFMSLYSNTNGATSGGAIAYQGIRSLFGRLSNPDLQWEETRKLQLGLELGFINNRVLANLTWFRNRTGNSLGSVNMPVIAGASALLTNFPALIQNAGWELTITTENIKTKNFTWSSTLNLTRPRNTLVAFPDLENSTSASDLVIGQPLGMSRTYSFYGVDPLTGYYLVRDTKGGLTSSPNFATDRTVWTNENQLLFGGLQNSLQYKGVQFSFFLQYVQQKGYDFLQVPPYVPGVFSTIPPYQNQPVTVLDRWQQPGDQRPYARFSTSPTGFPEGNRAFRNLPYLRLQNVSLSYTVPEKILKTMRLSSLSAFLHGQNLYTWTNYQGFNPETRSVFSIPPLRMITFGVNIGF